MTEADSTKRYRCSICGRTSTYIGPLPGLFPFCSSRCKMVDLGRWFNEQYHIDRELTPEELGDVGPAGPHDSEY